MEIKTIEELACIPVENDDFAAASDQDEGDVILRPSLNYWQDAWRRLRKNPVAILAIVMLAALAVMCVVGPGMTGYDYDAVSLSEKNALPSSEHWFGTDKMGRDLFTRVWIGGRTVSYTHLVVVGMKDWIRKGKAKGAVCYLHTGGFGSLFAQY